MDDRVKLLRTNTPFPFNTICEVKATLSRCINGAPKAPNVILSNSRKIVEVGGNPIDILKMQQGIPNMCNDLDKMFVDLCCGFIFEEFEKVVQGAFDAHNTDIHIKDNLRETTPGYSFFEDPRNPFAEYRDLLFNAIMDRNFNTFTHERPLYREGADGELHFEQSEVRKWFARVDEFIQV